MESENKKSFIIACFATVVVTAFCSGDVRAGWSSLREWLLVPVHAHADHTVKPHEKPSSQGKSFETFFDDIVDLRLEMDRMFQRSFDRFSKAKDWNAHNIDSGAIDIRDVGSAYVVMLDMPGVDKKKIVLHVVGNLLKVSAIREERVEEQTGEFTRRERRVGQFRRTIELPGPVRRAGARAKYENGVLTVTLSKDDTVPIESDAIEVE